jgi:hypothetical protein
MLLARRALGPPLSREDVEDLHVHSAAILRDTLP